MAGIKGTKRIDEQEYDKMQAMLGVGLKAGQVKKLMGRSYATIAQVRRSKDYTHFKMLKARTKTPVQGASPTATTKTVRFYAPEDAQMIMDKLGTIETQLKQVTRILAGKETKVGAAFWKR